MIRMERERKRLEEVAVQRGFKTFAELLEDMYVVQQIPLKTLAKDLFTPMWTLRKRLRELGVQMRSRGGRNNVKLEAITADVIAEVSRDGIMTVADRIGMHEQILKQRLEKWYEEHGGEELDKILRESDDPLRRRTQLPRRT